jgi:hypothetical protein
MMGVILNDRAELETVSGHVHREGVLVTPWEAVAYDQIVLAAQSGVPCPLNLDIEMLIGCNSGSVVSTVVKRLETKGLIVVRRFQRFREVQIVATGQWTARSPHQHSEQPHVPRRKGASRSAMPTERKLYRKGRL